MQMTNTLSKEALLFEYVRCGLLQFGNFELADGSFAPIGFHISMLPSFPVLMQTTAQLLSSHFTVETLRDRLLSMQDSTALGGVISVLTGMPQMYPRDDRIKPYTLSYSIEGTADVGNPMRLLTDVLIDGERELKLMQRSNRIGLPVQKIVAVLDAERPRPTELSKIEIHALFGLTEVITWLVDEQKIRPALAEAVQHWQQTE